jgi:hypothetical protein
MRHLHQTLVAFRAAVEQIVPLVQSTATLTDPVPLPDAIRSLVRFLMQVTRAQAGLLLVRQYDANRQPAEICRVYDADGKPMQMPLAPFARSVAGSAASLGQPSVMNELQANAGGGVELQSFEREHRNLLAVPMTVASGTQVVIELFDKPNGFNIDDQHVARSAANLGVELMRQALGQRITHELLFDAVAAALKASDQMTASLQNQANPPPQVIEQLRAGLQDSHEEGAEISLLLAEAIRTLASRHGQPALEHCLRLVEEVRKLLDRTTGSE